MTIKPSSGHNIADLPAAERERIAMERLHALARHKARQGLPFEVESQFNRILREKSTKKKVWREWAAVELLAIEDEGIREGVRKRLNEWLDGIGQT